MANTKTVYLVVHSQSKNNSLGWGIDTVYVDFDNPANEEFILLPLGEHQTTSWAWLTTFGSYLSKSEAEKALDFMISNNAPANIPPGEYLSWKKQCLDIAETYKG